MECRCGGATKEAKTARSKAGIVFEYRVCSSCGRNGYGTLWVHGEAVAFGIEAQRRFIELDGPEADPSTAPAPAPEQPVSPVVVVATPQYSEDWAPVSDRPAGADLIRVRFVTGGYCIERPSYFDERWDLIDAWQLYDNRAALAASFTPPPIPAELRVSSLHTERQVARPQSRAVRREPQPAPAPAPAPGMVPTSPGDSVPVGSTFSLF